MHLAALWQLAKKGAGAAKDAALGGAGAWLFNRLQLNRLGTMTSLQIDSDHQIISVSLDLQGEDNPIDLTIAYQLLEERGESIVEIVRVDSSRQWIATLANDLIPADKKRHVIPPLVKAALTRMVK